jgi:hypothetical protein
MDYSAKSLKVKSDEKIKLLKEKSTAEKKSKAIFRELIKTNKPRLYKAALELKRSVQLPTNPFESSKWWDNHEFTNLLFDSGFDIVNHDSEHFGSWFGPIHSLTPTELRLLEEYLEINFDDIKSQAKTVKSVGINEIIHNYKKNSVRTINILRLLVCFHKIYILYVYENEKNSSSNEIYSQLQDVIEYVTSYIPDIFKTINPTVVESDELFSISWRYPSKSVPNNDLLSAETLNWLSSMNGNKIFEALYGAIEKTAESGKLFFETKITCDSNQLINFVDNNISCSDSQFTSTSIKDLFETLGYKVDFIKKSTSQFLKISWG